MAQLHELNRDSQQGSTSGQSPLAIALHQRRRSLSASSFVTSSTSSHCVRTKTGSSTAQGCEPPDDRPSTSHSRTHSSSSHSRFVTSSTDFHLPKRSLYSPTLSASSTSPIVEGAQDGFTSLPLLRRKAAAAVLAHTSRKGFRRSSMLGKVVSKNGGEVSYDGEDEEMDVEEEDDRDLSPSQSPMLDRDDEDMQMNTGDVLLVELTGSSSPPLNSTLHRNSGATIAVRRAVQRRTNLMPKDRGVQRVAASLRDESRPGEGEIASEAKLQRRLGPESDSMTPTTPKLIARRSQSPFGPSSGGLLDRGMDGDDLYFPEGTTQYDLSDDSYDGDDDMNLSRNAISAPIDNDSTDKYQAGIAIPGTNGQTAQKDKLWLNFREAGNPRLSPNADRSMARSRGASVTPGAVNMGTGQLSGSLGSALDQAMELEMFTHNTSSSPSLWGRIAKRKVGDDRYDPYASSAIHKRRAVSPVAFVSANNSRAMSSSVLSPGLLSQASPNCNILTANLPTPTPLSIPSPTLSVSARGIGGLSGSLPRSFPSLPSSRAAIAAPASTNPSPSSTRPSTPTNGLPNPFTAIPSPSILNGKTGGAGVGGNGGSGPGYGSGALGLSLGGGSKRFKQEQIEMEEEEGMLGDVSAIQLGEL